MEPMKVEMKEGNVIPESQKQEEIIPQVTPKEEPKYVSLKDLEKVNQAINNTREFNNRKMSEITDKIEKLYEILNPKPLATGDDDIDKLVEKDWKLGVAKVVKNVLAEERTATQVQSEQQMINNILQESKEKVLAKHSELSDPESEKAKIFLQVLEENPDFKVNPRGPLLAAYEMENRLKQRGTIESEAKETPKVPSAAKESRAKAASIPAGTPAGNKNGYTLTKQDMDFCRLNGINPENYRRLKGQKETTA